MHPSNRVATADLSTAGRDFGPDDVSEIIAQAEGLALPLAVKALPLCAGGSLGFAELYQRLVLAGQKTA